MTDITVLELRETRYYEYVNAFHENDCMTIVDTYVQEKEKQCTHDELYLPGTYFNLSKPHAGRKRFRNQNGRGLSLYRCGDGSV